MPASSQSDRHVLIERAAALAASQADARAHARGIASERIAVVTFVSAGQIVAVEIDEVREFVAPVRWTPVPGLPAPFSGLANLRGALLPVIPASRLLGQADAGTAPAHLLVLGRARAEVALRIDAPGESQSIRKDELRAPPTQNHYLKAVTVDGLALLDAAALTQRNETASAAPSAAQESKA